MMKKKYLQPETDILYMGLEQMIAASGDYIEVDYNESGQPEEAISRVVFIDMLMDLD